MGLVRVARFRGIEEWKLWVRSEGGAGYPDLEHGSRAARPVGDGVWSPSDQFCRCASYLAQWFRSMHPSARTADPWKERSTHDRRGEPPQLVTGGTKPSAAR